MTPYRAALLILFAVTVGTAGSALATGKRQCAEDYRRFCSQSEFETRGLENCMRRHGVSSSKRCVKGLIQAGAVSQAEVNRRRAALGR